MFSKVFKFYFYLFIICQFGLCSIAMAFITSQETFNGIMCYDALNVTWDSTENTAYLIPSESMSQKWQVVWNPGVGPMGRTTLNDDLDCQFRFESKEINDRKIHEIVAASCRNEDETAFFKLEKVTFHGVQNEWTGFSLSLEGEIQSMAKIPELGPWPGDRLNHKQMYTSKFGPGKTYVLTGCTAFGVPK